MDQPTDCTFPSSESSTAAWSQELNSLHARLDVTTEDSGFQNELSILNTEVLNTLIHSGSVRPQTQRRDRNGIAPFSLFFSQYTPGNTHVMDEHNLLAWNIQD